MSQADNATRHVLEKRCFFPKKILNNIFMFLNFTFNFLYEPCLQQHLLHCHTTTGVSYTIAILLLEKKPLQAVADRGVSWPWDPLHSGALLPYVSNVNSRLSCGKFRFSCAFRCILH